MHQGSKHRCFQYYGSSKERASYLTVDRLIIIVLILLQLRHIRRIGLRGYQARTEAAGWCSSWRDATYVRNYGCASYYLKWQFKNVVKNVEYCIDYVVKNCYHENDNYANMYYK
jgi:hypothetical protein